MTLNRLHHSLEQYTIIPPKQILV